MTGGTVPLPLPGLNIHLRAGLCPASFLPLAPVEGHHVQDKPRLPAGGAPRVPLVSACPASWLLLCCRLLHLGAPVWRPAVHLWLARIHSSAYVPACLAPSVTSLQLPPGLLCRQGVQLRRAGRQLRLDQQQARVRGAGRADMLLPPDALLPLHRVCVRHDWRPPKDLLLRKLLLRGGGRPLMCHVVHLLWQWRRCP